MRDATEVAVLSCLASHANEDGQSCFAGVPRIAKLVRRSERTVQRTIDALEVAGWLTVRRGDGAGNLTQYEINVDMLKGCQDVTLLSKSKRVTLAQKRVTPAPKKGDIGDLPLFEGNVVKQKASVTPPNPLVTEGAEERQSAKREQVEDAISQVCSALGISNPRKRKVIGRAIELEAEKGEQPPSTALAMIAALRRKAELSGLLRPCGLDKFLGDGLWLDEDRWYWDKDALREDRRRVEAGVGMR